VRVTPSPPVTPYGTSRACNTLPPRASSFFCAASLYLTTCPASLGPLRVGQQLQLWHLALRPPRPTGCVHVTPSRS